jgi:eukaryotic-like serine/threonine-protein kinase
MALQPGNHLGPYEIVSAIGAGGMGEVYRARDPKLARDVAIKVLPEAFAGDAARMARFQREAKVLASLSHQEHLPVRLTIRLGSDGDWSLQPLLTKCLA